jgi:hypothetical protein
VTMALRTVKHENGAVAMEGEIDASGRRQGKWTFYDEAGQQTKVVKFENNKPVASKSKKFFASPTTWTIVAAVSAPAIIFGVSELAR